MIADLIDYLAVVTGICLVMCVLCAIAEAGERYFQRRSRR